MNVFSNPAEKSGKNTPNIFIKKLKSSLSLLISLLLFSCSTENQENRSATYISTTKGEGFFILATARKAAPLVVSSADFPGVIRMLKLVQTDISRVTDAMPNIVMDDVPREKRIVIIGTLGKSQLLDRLIQENKIDVTDIAGKWESFLIQTVEHPVAGVEEALVIAGSDKRGTIFGLFDLAEKIGVSPWYWWADVPVKKSRNLYVKPGRTTFGEPKVKYRGIFLNDEQPALFGWAYEKYGGFNAKFYENVFELILRLKGNFLWPAMWGRAFYVDDPVNPQLADEYGIVIGTSHHEPMMRAHAEWAQFGSGPWNYEANQVRLRKFWTEGIQRMGNYESIITLAMRGDGDEPMTESANIALLQRIVKDQREIIGQVTGKEVTAFPQVWALYKEVQEYYDKGMRVPDDVTLLLCDDNWGNIRKLPKLEDPPRSGGYGIYYHYDYVGDPRNYKWLNTNQISRVWEQMHLAYQFGAREIWIVNVGDLKPMEFPIEFFLDYAWDPDAISAEQIPEYTRQWAAEQFGAKYSDEIAHILDTYTRFNSRRKPELLDSTTYSLVHHREAETVVAEYKELEAKTRRIADKLAPEYRDAFYQLVLHPVEACANLNELYVTVGKNHLYAAQGRAKTNALAQKAKQLFDRDVEITEYYSHILAGGKWNHFMDQTHIGYTYWQQPEENAMPKVKEIEIPTAAEMGVAIEGSEKWWPAEKDEAILPEFDRFNQQVVYIELFNRGQQPFDYTAESGASWVKVEPAQGKIEQEMRLWVKIDWPNAPAGEHRVPIRINGPDQVSVSVVAPIRNGSLAEKQLGNCFIESNNVVSMEAEHHANAFNTPAITWQKIPQLGRTLSAMTPFPVSAPAQSLSNESARLEYEMFLNSQGQIHVHAYLSPTLNFHNTQGLRYGISFDDEPIQIRNMHANNAHEHWQESVRNNITVITSAHVIDNPGKHVLKFWAIDPGVVLQKLVVEIGKTPQTYLGPPESHRIPKPAAAD